MSSKIKVYKDNPTAGQKDGVLVSNVGDPQDPAWNPIHSGAIEVPEEGFTTGEWITCAVRCDDGYETEEKEGKHVTLNLENGTAAKEKWQLALNTETPELWGASLEITSQVTDVNTLFYIRARAVAGEEPVNDISVTCKALALIGASGY